MPNKIITIVDFKYKGSVPGFLIAVMDAIDKLEKNEEIKQEKIPDDTELIKFEDLLKMILNPGK